MVDESREISVKEQIIVFIRFVDSSGHIVERLLGITHVLDTTSTSLKVAIEDLLTRHGLNISRIRGQGYDGATLVGVAKENEDVGDFFIIVSDTIETRTGLNQEAVLQRPGDTHRGSHYGALLSIVTLFSQVIDVIDEIRQDLKQRVEAFRNSFARFDKDRLVRLALLYPNDFSNIELELLDNQLQTYFVDVTSDPAFSKLDGIDELAKKNGGNEKTFRLYIGVFAFKVVFDPTGCNY
ncbi:PREDICTED: uncharacterized protein LOC109167846 [Ipomoea nil]|uniref:uncharacterized protein LOC109167846 n=1 Tax=Ipomoea nil TaxID=35883 RepID=UPI000900FCAD|nr:PREDICTED: uncharacterized protein LOC109167846 [Ipomoea nil]